MFENIKKLVETESAEQLASVREYFEKYPEQAIRSYSTVTRWGQYQAGKIDAETAAGFAYKRKAREIEKRTAEKLARLDRLADASEVQAVRISVEWVKSSVWGYNPQAEITVYYSEGGASTYTGSASGCGYDKRTTAVGEALNQCDGIIKALCACKEKNITPEGKEHNRGAGYSNADAVAYGAGYGAIPYFEGGVGMSSFERVFNACGFILRNVHETKRTDYYYFEKKEV